MISERLRKLRIERDLLQKDVAEQINITTSAYGFYEQGKRTPDASTLEKLADFFNVSVDYILGRSKVRKPKEEEDISLENNHGIETGAFHYKGTEGLPEEAIKQIEDYIELIKLKYNLGRTLKKKDNENEKKPE